MDGEVELLEQPVPRASAKVHCGALVAVLAIFGALTAALVVGALFGTGTREKRYEWQLQRVLVPLSSGGQLSVTLAMPLGAPGERFPVVAEALPYRKDDMFYPWRYPMWDYFARRGFVFAAIDCEGTGSSPGRTIDKEYSERELRGEQEAIAWLAQQVWSLGKVGLVGKSWSAFNALMLAARQTEHLAAIYVAHGSADLYFNGWQTS
jgi:predicted acyl esterase